MAHHGDETASAANNKAAVDKNFNAPVGMDAAPAAGAGSAAEDSAQMQLETKVE